MKIQIIAFIALFFCIAGVLSAAFNRFLPKWFCDVMGWHVQPKKLGFDGCSLNGVCSRCGKPVMQDSQGNWF